MHIRSSMYIYDAISYWILRLLWTKKMDLHHRNKFAEWEFLDF